MSHQQDLQMLDHYQREYNDTRAAFLSDGKISDDIEKPVLDDIERMIAQIRQRINEHIAAERNVTCNYQSAPESGMRNVQVSQAESAAQQSEADMSIDDTQPHPGSPPTPQCGGDELGSNEDNPLRVPAPPDGGSDVIDASKVIFNASGVIVINGRTTSESNFPGRNTGTVAIDAGQSGQVRINVRMEIQQASMRSGGLAQMTQDFSVTWDISADVRGLLTIGTAEEQIDAHTGEVALRLDSINPQAGPSNVQRSHVLVSPIVFNVPASNTVSIGVVSAEITNPSRQIQRSLRLNINVCNIPEPTPAPTPEPLAPTRSNNSHQVFFEFDEDTVSRDEKRRIDTWYQGLSETTRQRIAAGEPIVAISGITNTRGTEDHNDPLAVRRANNVHTYLREQLAGTRLNANVVGCGERCAPSPDNVRDPRYQRVDIAVTETN